MGTFLIGPTKGVRKVQPMVVDSSGGLLNKIGLNCSGPFDGHRTPIGYQTIYITLIGQQVHDHEVQKNLSSLYLILIKTLSLILSAQECPADAETSNIVPIAVGAALAALVLIVLIAYLISRNRSQRGYESVQVNSVQQGQLSTTRSTQCSNVISLHEGHIFSANQ